MAETDKIVLEPCPFCGGCDTPTIKPNGIGDLYVVCDSNEDGCGASTSDAHCETERGAIQRWNLRSPSLERVAVLEEDNERLRGLVYALSDALTDEGADWSNEGVANLRDRCARELPDVEWLQPYLKDQSDAT